MISHLRSALALTILGVPVTLPAQEAWTVRPEWVRAHESFLASDVETQKWTALAKIEVQWPEWSRHSDYVYFLGVPPGGQQGLFRLRISDDKLEQVVSLKDFRLAPEDWVGLAPDDSPLLLRDAGTQDIYAPDWEEP